MHKSDTREINTFLKYNDYFSIKIEISLSYSH